NYSDGLTDLPLNMMIDEFHRVDKIGSFMTYQPTQSFHVVNVAGNGIVNGISPISKSGLWINAGYFIFRQDFFDYIEAGEELVTEPFQRLIEMKQLYGYRYMDFGPPWIPSRTSSCWTGCRRRAALPGECGIRTGWILAKRLMEQRAYAKYKVCYAGERGT